MAFVGDAFRFVTSTVDARLVTPVAQRLANSVANPYVLSYVLWDRVKKLTPQRARDLTRLLSTAAFNGLGVLSAEEARALGVSARRLQDELVAATVTPQGRDVVLNSVATAAKAAQALNTPETKIATQQAFETLQSLVDFFASDHGRKVIATAGECVTRLCEVAASPETAVLLAEVATNMCHALEVEALRREADLATAAAAKEKETLAPAHVQARVQQPRHEVHSRVFHAEEDKPTEAGSRSRASSAADTVFETESNFSEFSLPPSRANTPATAQYAAHSELHSRLAEPLAPPRHRPHHHHHHDDDHEDNNGVDDLPPPANTRPLERSALRSVRIEKDVLLKMGVNPSMLDEVQRILDRLHDEQQREEAAATAPMVREEDEQEESKHYTDDEADLEISSAFGIRSSSLPLEPEPPVVDDEAKTEEEQDGVILPEWNPEPMRAALRRRHVAAGQQASQRHTFEDQSREMTQLLAKRRVAHGDLQPADVIACRVISQILIAAFALVLILLLLALTRRILA